MIYFILLLCTLICILHRQKKCFDKYNEPWATAIRLQNNQVHASSKKDWRLYTGYKAEAFEPSVAPYKVIPGRYNGLKVRSFHVPNGTVHFGCTAPNQTISRLVIVLVSRIQKSGTGNNNFHRNGLFQFDVPTEISVTGLNERRPKTVLECTVD